MGVGCADILANMKLLVLPAGLVGFFAYHLLFAIYIQLSVKSRQRKGHGVWVVVAGCFFAGLVFVLQHPDSIVFKNHFVFVRVADSWVCTGRVVVIVVVIIIWLNCFILFIYINY